MRLDALLARFGYCSRREARTWLQANRVTHSGERCVNPAAKVLPHAVLVNGEPVEFADGLYIALNKPAGYTCSHDAAESPLIYDLLPPRWLRRNPPVSTVGRLDKDTSGLILLSDDGAFIHRMTAPKHHVPKVYRAITEQAVPPDAVRLFAAGTLVLHGEKQACAPCDLQIIEPCKVQLTLTEGKYHQVRRMLAAVGAPVRELHRLAIGRLALSQLQLEPGAWAPIDPATVTA